MGMGGWVLRERGAPACRGTRAGRQPGEGGGSCSLPLYGRLPSVGIPGDEDSPSVLPRHQENCRQETPSHALPGLTAQLLCAAGQEPRTQPEGHRQSFGEASPKGSHPGPGTGWPCRNIPAMCAGLAASIPATSAPLAGHPPSRPRQLPAQECTSRQRIRHMPPPRRAGSCLLRLLEASMPGPCRGVCCPPGLLRGEGASPAPRTGLGCRCLVINPPRERGELSCLLPLSETYLLDKDEYKQDFCPGPDITPSWRILGLQLYQYNEAKNKEILNLNQCS